MFSNSMSNQLTSSATWRSKARVLSPTSTEWVCSGSRIFAPSGSCRFGAAGLNELFQFA